MKPTINRKAVQKYKPALTGLLMSATLMFSQACTSDDKAASQQAENTAFCLTPALKEKVKIEPVNLAKVAEYKRLPGKVEYNPDKKVQYVSLVGGVITDTFFTLGEKVRKGQVLAEIRSTELTALESERQILESKLLVAERNVKSVQGMYDDNIASERDLIEAESERNSLVSELNKIKADLSLFSASAKGDVFQIKAPMGGYIVSKNISAGLQIAAEGEPLFAISDLNEVWVTANVYAGDLSFVQEGMKVNITSTSYKDQVFTGTIKAISQVFDTEENVLKARIVMNNQDLRLKPGMFVDVSVDTNKGHEAIQVPEKAVIFGNNKYYLVTYKDDCNVKVQEVGIGSKSNGSYYLTSGVNPGDTIISQSHLLIYESLKNIK